jgi:hypothetical protein
MGAVKPSIHQPSAGPRFADPTVAVATQRGKVRRPAAAPNTPIGTALRSAVDTTLSRMLDAAATAELIRTLRVGLAVTSATGDICRLPAAVGAIRDAIDSLQQADLSQARAALVTARTLLPSPTEGTKTTADVRGQTPVSRR